MFDRELLHNADEPTRRQFLASAARACLGVTAGALASPLASALGQSPPASTAKAKHVIYLFMDGGMSQLDTFDPKPGREVQGPTGVIQTALPGVQLSEHFPKLAAQLNKLCLVRSMTSETGAHAPGAYLMRTSYKEVNTARHPGLGSWTQKILGKLNEQLPGSVVIGNSARHPGPGFLDARFGPVPIADPIAGLQNTKPPSYLSESRFDRRMQLAGEFDGAFQKKYNHREVRAYSELYEEAIKLLKSEDLKAFDIAQEPASAYEAYGESPLGKGCLLARRLVENGVRFVEVSYGSWDMHRDCFQSLPEPTAALDQSLTALLADLESKSLLDETLVVVATEFGRSPKVNENTGRDHHPGAFTCLLAGGGIRGGQVFGSSDSDGRSVKTDRLGVQDFNATIAHALGLPITKEFMSPAGRPFKVAAEGKPVMKLFG